MWLRGWAARSIAIALVATGCSGIGDLSERPAPADLNPAVTSTGDPGDGDVAGSDGTGDGDLEANGGEAESDGQPTPDLPVVAGFGDGWLAGAWAVAGADRSVAATLAGSVGDFGAAAGDDRSDSEAFALAVEAAARIDGPAVVTIPAGTYLLTEPLVLSSGVILRGEGEVSELLIDFDDREGPAVVAEGRPAGTWLPVIGDVEPGTDALDLTDSADLGVGDVIEIEQRSNPEEMYTRDEWRVSWGQGSVGELNRIAAVDGTTITLASPLNGRYLSSLDTAVRRIEPVENVGIERLSLARLDEGFGHTIHFEFGTEVWIDEVTSRRTSRAHVSMNQVYRCRVEDSTFNLATDYGDGGRAYGISLARHVTGCLISGNALWDLRHAIIIQLGASGNVVTGNDARGSAGYEDRRPRADLSIHGHLPRANLFEGNIFDRVVFADWWGPSGPGNTLFRNCVLDHVVVADGSDDQVVVGNLIGAGDLTVLPGISGTVAVDNMILDETGGLAPADFETGVAGDVDTIPPPPSLIGVAEVDVGADAGPGLAIDVDTGACRVQASNRSPLAG